MTETGAPRPAFTPVDPASWPRREYFAYYFEKLKCRYSLTAQLDIGLLLRCRARAGRKFFPVLLYMIMRAVNKAAQPEQGAAQSRAQAGAEGQARGRKRGRGPDLSVLERGGNEAFRMGFDHQGRLGFWDYCNPVYTLFHKDDLSFSDVWSLWTPDFSGFYERVLADMARWGRVKGLKARPGTPENFCSISSLPWLSFTSFAQDTYAESRLLAPLIRVGRHFTQGRKTLLPVALSVHHAVADGFHTAKLYHDMQAVADTAEQWLR